MYYTFKFIYIEDVSYSFKIHIYIVFKLRVNISDFHASIGPNHAL